MWWHRLIPRSWRRTLPPRDADRPGWGDVHVKGFIVKGVNIHQTEVDPANDEKKEGGLSPRVTAAATTVLLGIVASLLVALGTSGGSSNPGEAPREHEAPPPVTGMPPEGVPVPEAASGAGDTPPSAEDAATSDREESRPDSSVEGVTHGCNTFGERCDGNPIYAGIPRDGAGPETWRLIAEVDNGTPLLARCWTDGREYTNYRVSPPDLGPDPYASSVHFNVLAPDGSAWGWIPDTWFERDKDERMGLPSCDDLEVG